MAKYCSNCGNKIEDGEKFCSKCGKRTTEEKTNNEFNYTSSNTSNAPKSKIVAGLLGIFLGSLGIHNFYLGNTNRGLTQLLVSLIGGIFTCGLASIAMEIWGLIEGIQILTGTINTDADGNPLGE